MIDEKDKEKRAKIRAILGVGVVAVMMGAAVWLSQLIIDVRGQMMGQYMHIDQETSNVAFDVALEEEVDKRNVDINRIKTLLVHRDEIGQIVSELERKAKGHGVELRVPNIREQTDEEEVLVRSNDSWGEVKLELVATGLPEDLLRFLYTVEHEPYLMTAVDWQLEVKAPVISRGTAAQLPSRAVAEAPKGQEVLMENSGTLEVDVILTTVANKEMIRVEDNQGL